MSEPTLYTHPQTRGRIAHWMLEEAGEPYDTVWLDCGTSMKSPECLAINPMGKVPALRHGSVVVTEAAAICACLVDAFPAAGLAPQTAAERASYWRWMFFAAGPLAQEVVARAVGWAVPEGRSGMVGFGSYADTLAALEQGLTRGPLVCGERFTAAGVYDGSGVAWGLMFGTIERRPVYEACADRVMARAACARSERINTERLKLAGASG